MTEEIKRKLENVEDMIALLQNDLMNEEGASTEKITHSSLEILKDYIHNIAMEIEC